MADALDPQVVVPPVTATPFFDTMTEEWGDPKTVRDYLVSAHRRELEQATRPPIVCVTVEGVTGHFTMDTANGAVDWRPEPAPRPDAPLTMPGLTCA